MRASFRGSINCVNTIKEIHYLAFHECRLLNNIEIPDNCIEIGQLAFANCYSLNNLIISNFVSNYGPAAYVHNGATLNSNNVNYNNNIANANGGAIYSEYGNLVIIGSTFTNNEAKGTYGTSTGVGSAIYDHNHDCIGEDCQYCQVVSLQQELMRLVLLSYFSASFALIFVQLIMNINSRGDDEKQSINLVANKVKLTA